MKLKCNLERINKIVFTNSLKKSGAKMSITFFMVKENKQQAFIISIIYFTLKVRVEAYNNFAEK